MIALGGPKLKLHQPRFQRGYNRGFNDSTGWA